MPALSEFDTEIAPFQQCQDNSMVDPKVEFSRCLITGASGFIGSRYCQQLVGEDLARYVPMVRRPDAVGSLQALGLMPVQGDLRDRRQVDAALSGCDAVLHMAHGGDGPAATRLLVERAIAARIHRFVHISSMAVHGPNPGPDATVEETAVIRRYDHDYSDSKAEQEEIVQAAIDRGDLPAVILRPTIVYGPGSHFVTLIIEEARQGVVRCFDEGVGVCNAVYIDDVCAAIGLALNHPVAPGQAMFINGDEPVSWREFISTFASMVAPRLPLESLSAAAALRYWEAHPEHAVATNLPARILRKIAKLLRDPPPPTPWPPLGRVQREMVSVTFSNQRAKRVLGWSPEFDFSTGSSLTRAWLERTGLLNSCGPAWQS